MIKRQAKKLIMDIITDALINQRVELYESYRTHMKDSNQLPESSLELLFSKINKDYYDAVANQALDKVRQISPETSKRLSEAFVNQKLYDKSNEYSFHYYSADKVFALSYYAVTGKSAPKKHVIAAKQLQSYSMQDVLRQVYSEQKQNSNNSEATN